MMATKRIIVQQLNRPSALISFLSTAQFLLHIKADLRIHAASNVQCVMSEPIIHCTHTRTHAHTIRYVWQAY